MRLFPRSSKYNTDKFTIFKLSSVCLNYSHRVIYQIIFCLWRVGGGGGGEVGGGGAIVFQSVVHHFLSAAAALNNFTPYPCFFH